MRGIPSDQSPYPKSQLPPGFSTEIEPMVVLYRPQIPPNTGNISRLCVGVNMPLRIVGKPAFSISDRSARRAGLDYWDNLDFMQYSTFSSFAKSIGKRRVVVITKKGSQSLFEFTFKSDDVFFFGNETKGLPPRLMNLFPERVRLPMSKNVRSLNLSNAVAIVVYEFLRQMNRKG